MHAVSIMFRMESPPHAAAPSFDLSAHATAGGRPLEAALTLATAQAQVRVRLPAGGEPGRAEARLPDGRTWSAKHYWREPDGGLVYEFDEALPAGTLRLVVPFEPLAR